MFIEETRSDISSSLIRSVLFKTNRTFSGETFSSINVSIQLLYLILNPSIGCDASRSKRIKLAYFTSSNVDLNDSIKYAGSRLMNPTVSDRSTFELSIAKDLVEVDKVVKGVFSTFLDSPVRRLNIVVLPAPVYPDNEIVGMLNLCLWIL